MNDFEQCRGTGRADVRSDLLLTRTEAELPDAAAALEPGDGRDVAGQLVQRPGRLTHVLRVKNAPEPISELPDLLEVAVHGYARPLVTTDDPEEQPQVVEVD